MKENIFPFSFVEKRLQSPTTLSEKGDISGPKRSANRKKNETRMAGMKIHGGSPKNMKPMYDGLFATVTTGASVHQLREMCLVSPVLVERVIPNIVNENVKKFESSYVNFIRSVNVLYKDGLVSKAKYNSIRSSLSMTSNEDNTGKSHVKFMKSCLIPKLMPYKQLMVKVNAINIGTLHDVRETLCDGLDNADKVDGKYRNLTELLLRLAQFYLEANKHRADKLNWFGNEVGSFKVAIGGDGAPFGKDDTALSWLVSFLNCGPRVCSHEENYLLLGANCKEDCEPIRRYVCKLAEEMNEVQKKTFSVNVDGKDIPVSFSFAMFPNDMKYLAFLAGELSVSAKFFSPFANVQKVDICDVTATFGVEISNKWQPWGYEQRLAVAGAVAKKKEELANSHLKPATIRQKITSFIAQKKSRQEFPPLLGKAIDKVKVEPLHAKNNAWQQWHAMVMKYVLSRTNVSSCESVSDTPAFSCFKRYYETVRFTLKATRLAKKVRKWFCDGRLKNKDLEYRFTGKESLIMCHQFMTLLSALELEDDQPLHSFALHLFATIAVNLRDSVSIFSRITVTDEEVIRLKEVASSYFRACALFSSVSPTTWTIGHCVPVHTKQIKQQLGLGLGVNTMEGR